MNLKIFKCWKEIDRNFNTKKIQQSQPKNVRTLLQYHHQMVGVAETFVDLTITTIFFHHLQYFNKVPFDPVIYHSYNMSTETMRRTIINHESPLLRPTTQRQPEDTPDLTWPGLDLQLTPSGAALTRWRFQSRTRTVNAVLASVL